MKNYPYRRSPRMKGYDYSQQGAYFITICTQNRLCLFAEIVNDELVLSPAGNMIKNYWEQIPIKFPDVFLADFVVMPNHFHGVLFMESVNQQTTLPQIIQWFKTVTTNGYIKGVKQEGWEAFMGKLWQTSFYDHIIQDENSLYKIVDYILFNPEKWVDDALHPRFNAPPK